MRSEENQKLKDIIIDQQLYIQDLKAVILDYEQFAEAVNEELDEMKEEWRIWHPDMGVAPSELDWDDTVIVKFRDGKVSPKAPVVTFEWGTTSRDGSQIPKAYQIISYKVKD